MDRPKRSFQEEHAAFFDQIELISTFVLANLLWAIVSIPLITMPAATAGLFNIMSRRVRGQSSEVFRDFVAGFRQYWLKATLVMLINLGIGGLVLLNLHIFSLMGGMNPVAFLSRSLTLFFAVMLLLVNIYIWPLLVTTERSLRDLVITAVKLVFAYPLRSTLIVIVGLLPIFISLLLPQGIFALLTVSVTIYILTRGTWPIIRQHIEVVS